ncbi:unnamed protein product [Oppiella nova]|uniref:Uncharacterized protein n=1 Tax=Oppiella nova TaxID=334625 RepID=A0A7R9M8R7_9ACAR|nr:unnamed protein product [Oppiella nova]CAG2171582.1 unnamed protein product [Oppiella nova]
MHFIGVGVYLHPYHSLSQPSLQTQFIIRYIDYQCCRQNAWIATIGHKLSSQAHNSSKRKISHSYKLISVQRIGNRVIDIS